MFHTFPTNCFRLRNSFGLNCTNVCSFRDCKRSVSNTFSWITFRSQVACIVEQMSKKKFTITCACNETHTFARAYSMKLNCQMYSTMKTGYVNANHIHHKLSNIVQCKKISRSLLWRSEWNNFWLFLNIISILDRNLK